MPVRLPAAVSCSKPAGRRASAPCAWPGSSCATSATTRYTRIDPVPDGLIVAVGPNGEGKTNLLEGDALPVSRSASPACERAASRSCATAPRPAYARGEFETRDGRVLVEVEIPTGRARASVQSQPIAGPATARSPPARCASCSSDRSISPMRHAATRLRTRSGSWTRLAVLLQPDATTLTSSYERALRQRNRLLKEHDGRGAPPELEAWDEQLIETGIGRDPRRAPRPCDAIGARTASRQFCGGCGLRPGLVRYAPERAPPRRRGGVPSPARRAPIRRASAPDVARRPAPRRSGRSRCAISVPAVRVATARRGSRRSPAGSGSRRPSKPRSGSRRCCWWTTRSARSTRRRRDRIAGHLAAPRPGQVVDHASPTKPTCRRGRTAMLGRARRHRHRAREAA